MVLAGGHNKDSDQYCPNCGQRIWRLSEDRFLKCHRCGWTVSYPVLRWFTHPTWIRYYAHKIRHYPVSTFWSLLKVALVAGLLLFIVPILLPQGVLPNAVEPVSVSDIDGAFANISMDGSEEEAGVEQGYNLSKVEMRFITYLNEERSRRGLQNVSQRTVLTEMGENHSRDMAKHDYFAHVEPDGDSIEDRYRDRELLPECRLPIQGTDRYYPGAENILKAQVDASVRAQWAEDGEYYVNSEDDLAWLIFQEWMHSEPHREAMLVSSADEAGLGLNVTESDEVYASLELC